jgi:hypothetical protein
MFDYNWYDRLEGDEKLVAQALECLWLTAILVRKMRAEEEPEWKLEHAMRALEFVGAFDSLLGAVDIDNTINELPVRHAHRGLRAEIREYIVSREGGTYEEGG